MRDPNAFAEPKADTITFTLTGADSERIAKRNAVTPIVTVTITIRYSDGYGESITVGSD